MELIDRHALLKKVYEHPQEREQMTEGEWCRKCIYEAPKVEAEPVRHGRWILDHHGVVVCNLCRYPQQIGAKDFCGKCGARMDLRTPTEVQLDEAGSVMMGGADNG